MLMYDDVVITETVFDWIEVDNTYFRDYSWCDMKINIYFWQLEQFHNNQ